MNLREFIKDFRVNSLAEFRQVVTPRDEKHYRELMKHLHAMELDPANRSDPDLMGEIRRRRMELRGWAEKNIKREDTVKEVPGMSKIGSWAKGIGAKAAGALGAKGTQAGLQGELGVDAELKNIYDDWRFFMGRMKATDPSADYNNPTYEQLRTFLIQNDMKKHLSWLDRDWKNVKNLKSQDIDKIFTYMVGQETKELPKKKRAPTTQKQSPEDPNSYLKTFSQNPDLWDKVKLGMTQPANTQAAGVNHLGLPSDDVVKEDNEEFSFGQIAKAKAYAKLYVDNYTTAVKNIERIAKGLSSHPDVADALRKANEDDEPQITDYTDVVSPEEMAKIWYYDEKHGRAKDLQARFKTWQDYYKSDDFELDLDHLRSKFEDDDKDELMKKFLAKGGKIQKLKPGIPKGATHMDRRGDYKKSDFPNVKFQNRKDVEKSKSKALRSTPITSPMSDESVKEDSEASLLGAAQASLSHGLELADAVLKGDNNMAKVISSTIKESWPPLIDKIQNVYKTDSAKEELSKILNFDKKDYGLKERMPASIIKHKQKLDMMTDKELAIRFQDKDENTLRHMAWRHGYGKMSSHYWDRVQAGKQETTEDLDHLGLSIKKEDDEKSWAAYKVARDQKVDYANIMFRGKEIDHNSIDYDMKDFSDMIFELHGAKYIDGTPLTDEELEEFEKTDELLDWVAEDYATQGESVKEEAPFGTGMDLVRMAVFRKFISAEEYVNFAKELKTAGEEVANSEQYADWPDGEGFGSSDGNFAIRDLMSTAGYEFDDNDTSGRFVVTKMPKKLQKLGITNVRMKQPELPLKQEGDSDGVQPADLKRMGLSTPKAYVHKDGRTVMINKKDLQKYLKKGWQKSSLRAE